MFLKLKKDINNSNEINGKGKSNYFFQNSQLFTEDESFIDEFKKINFFVGSNNSGKSRFLRGLFKYDESDLEILENKISYDKIVKNINSTNLRNNIQYVNGLKSNSKYYSQINDFYKKCIDNKVTHFDLINNYHLYKKEFEANLLMKNDVEEFIKNQLNLTNKNNYLSVLNFNVQVEILQKAVDFSLKNRMSNKIYIPILRSLVQDDNLNKESFNKISELKYGLKDNVYTGLKLFDSFSELHNSEEIYLLEEFTTWIKQNFYDNEKLQLIPDRKSGNILLKIGGEMDTIFNIGDGIQQLILLMFPIFTAKNNTWFFIEEPETHLHPGLQRIFIETLSNDEYLKTKNLRYFFTTHSNHFLDLSLQTDDISIFQFQKESQQKFNIKNVKPNKETLDLLGVNNSSVLMANSSIWVEGPTDRKYISKFLKLFTQKEKIQNLKEDIDFAFFEYGGNLIEHYLFDEDFEEVFSEEEVREKINSFALSNKIFLLSDNDNAKGKKLKRREELEEISKAGKNFKYQNTNYREIENLLPLKVVKGFLVELVNSSEKKNINKISFNREDYISIGLGEFITNLFLENEIKDFKKFKDDSGTLKSSYKTKLCEFFIGGNYNYEELIENNEELNSIIFDLYKFINQK